MPGRTTTHAPTIDQNGRVHRHGCPMPAPTSTPASVPGFRIERCPACGAVRVTRAKEQTTAKVEP
jgi:hypothetical protein